MATVCTLVTAAFAATVVAGPLWVDAAVAACDPRSSCPPSRSQSALDFMKSLFEAPTAAKRGEQAPRAETARAKPSPARADAPTSRPAGKRAQKPVREEAKSELPGPEPVFAMPEWWNATPFQGRFAYAADNENPVLARGDTWPGAPGIAYDDEVKAPAAAIPVTSVLIANADELNEIDLAAPDLPADRFWLHALLAMGGTLMVLLALAGTLAAVSPEEPARAS